jgi:hypothetical protein
MTALTCPVIPHDVLNGAEYPDCIRDLSKDANSGAPFMMSYDMRLMTAEAASYLNCQVWLRQRGKVRGYQLDITHPDLTRKIAPSFFNFLHFYTLQDVCGQALRQINPSAEDEIYHCCISPHGVILVSTEIQLSCHAYGEQSAFVGLMQSGLSNHKSMEALTGLQECATALFSDQFSVGSKDKYTSVRVRLA